MHSCLARTALRSCQAGCIWGQRGQTHIESEIVCTKSSTGVTPHVQLDKKQHTAKALLYCVHDGTGHSLLDALPKAVPDRHTCQAAPLPVACLQALVSLALAHRLLRCCWRNLSFSTDVLQTCVTCFHHGCLNVDTSQTLCMGMHHAVEPQGSTS